MTVSCTPFTFFEAMSSFACPGRSVIIPRNGSPAAGVAGGSIEAMTFERQSPCFTE